MSKQGDETISRRKLMTGGGLLAAGSAAFLAGTGNAGTALAQNAGGFGEIDSGPPYPESSARQDVQDLRKWYGVATDLLGLKPSEASPNTGMVGAAFNEGKKIYRRIFTPDAKIFLGPNPIPDPSSPTRVGPDEWADFVHNALVGFLATQHLIGTQVADVDMLPAGPPGMSSSSTGHATVASYLHAWHQAADNQSTLLVLGTYRDKVRVDTLRSGLRGWQIYEMNLSFTVVGAWSTVLS